MDIMKAILDIEEKAQSIMNTMEEIGTETAAETEQRLAELDSGMKRDAEEKISEHKAEVKKAADKELKVLEEDFDKKRSTLESAFAAKKEVWIKKITDNVKEG